MDTIDTLIAKLQGMKSAGMAGDTPIAVPCRDNDGKSGFENHMPIQLEEVTEDSEDAMICAAYMRIGSFHDRAAFEASNFVTDVPGPYRATDVGSFDIWADDPQFK